MSDAGAGETITDSQQIEAAKETCELTAGNDVISCFPSSNTSFVQDQIARNSRVPQFTQANYVKIYIFRVDSGSQIFQSSDIINPSGTAGILTTMVNDTWWDNESTTDVIGSYPFYWVITPATKVLDGSETPQATFHAVRTATVTSISSTTGVPPPNISNSSSPSRRVVAGAAAGAVVGFLVLVVGVILLLSHWRRKRRPIIDQSRSAQLTSEIRPYPLPETSTPGPDLRLSEDSKVRLVYEPPVPVVSQTQKELKFTGSGPSAPGALSEPLQDGGSSTPSMQDRIQDLYREPQPSIRSSPTNPSSATPPDNENNELRRRVDMLTEEIERMRQLGMEPPPSYREAV